MIGDRPIGSLVRKSLWYGHCLLVEKTALKPYLIGSPHEGRNGVSNTRVNVIERNE